MSVHGCKEHVLLLAALLSEGPTPAGHHWEEALVTQRHLIGWERLVFQGAFMG